MKTTQDDM